MTRVNDGLPTPDFIDICLIEAKVTIVCGDICHSKSSDHGVESSEWIFFWQVLDYIQGNPYAVTNPLQ